MFDKILLNGIKKEKSNSLKKDKIVSESSNKFIYIYLYISRDIFYAILFHVKSSIFMFSQKRTYIYNFPRRYY